MPTIKRNSIVVDESLFIRDGYDGDAIERYKEQYESENPPPPLILQKSTLLLIDGFHRNRALAELDKEYVEVEYLDSDKPLVEAVKRNLFHGVPLTKRERNRMIQTFYNEPHNMTQAEIAGVFGLSPGRISQTLTTLGTKVANAKGELSDDKRRLINETERNEIIQACLDEKLTQEQIAEPYGIDRSRVSQIFSEFKDGLHSKYLGGWPLDFIMEDGPKKLTQNKLTEILRGYPDTDETIIEIPRIIHGDMFKEIDQISDHCADLIYVDPPHNVTEQSWDRFKTLEEFLTFTESWIKVTLPKLKDTGRLYVSFAQQWMFEFYEIMKPLAQRHNLIFTNLIVWNHPNNMQPQKKGSYKITWDPVFFYRKDKAQPISIPEGAAWSGQIGDYDCWNFAMPQTNFTQDRRVHPAQKPFDLLKVIILTGSKEGDLILDPFAGSGTTALACIGNKRNYVMIEQNDEYLKTMQGRVRDALGKR